MLMFDESDFDYSLYGFCERKEGELDLAFMDIQKDNKNFKKGIYRIVSCHNIFDSNDYIKEVVFCMQKFLKEIFFYLKIDNGKKIFLCGLGNEDIVADSLGKKVCKKVFN